jgi:mono/diheme cytochrome c family protein
MRFLRDALLTLAALAFAAAILGYLFTRNGLSARTDPPAIEKAVAARVRWLSIPSGAKRQVSPRAGNREAWVEGGRQYEEHCAVCHEENGSGKTEIGRNVYPKVPDLRLEDTQRLSDGALYFVIANGVRYTAMPAWADEHTPDEIWKMVAFIRRLPKITPEELEKVTDEDVGNHFPGGSSLPGK